MPHLLLVDDDHHVRISISKFLRQKGWEVTTSGSAEEAADLVEGWQPDAVLLDWGLPGKSGKDLVIDWRAQGHSFPVILLTGRDGLEDLVTGLEAGADDYLRKPCYPQELLARLLARLRSHNPKGTSHVTLESCAVDLDLQQIDRGGVLERLTTREVDVLRFLSERPGEQVSREDLLREVWGYHSDNIMTRAVDNVIRRLRAKLEINAATPRHIITVHGVGYRFEP